LPHIAIIGAGITGVTTAYELLERGHDVTVLDRHRYAGMETSYANGGQLSASNAEVWNHRSTLLKGLSWMLQADAPLLLSPTPSWHKYSWIVEFIRHIPRYQQNTIETARLAIEARQHLFALAEREQIDFDLEKRGILHIYRDRTSFEHAAAVNTLLARAGLERHPVTSEEMQVLEPALQGAYYGGFYTPSDATGDIHKFTRGLASVCVRRGAKFIYDAAVEQITHTSSGIELSWSSRSPDRRAGGKERTKLSAQGIVICAGTSSREIASMVGDRVNIYPVKGYSITLPLESQESREAAPWVSFLDDEAKIVSSRLGSDRLRVAGTAEFNGFNRDIRADRINPLIEWTRQLFPSIDTSKAIPWSGLRPMTPSMLPIVGRGRRPNVFYNTGHGHLGWTLAAATAQSISEVITRYMPVGLGRKAA